MDSVTALLMEAQTPLQCEYDGQHKLQEFWVFHEEVNI